MIIKTFEGPPLPTNTYLLADEKTNNAVIIDPSSKTINKIKKEVEKNNYRVLYIINTHGHWDHITENSEQKEAFDCKILVHKSDSEMLKSPSSSAYLPFKINPSEADSFLKDNDNIKFGSLNFRVLHTPGHTAGSICLYEEKQGVLFTGDTLFRESHGRTDLVGGNKEKMNESLRRLAHLPAKTKVFPGHGPETSIAKEEWLKNI